MTNNKLPTLKLSELWPFKVYQKWTNQISPFTHIFYLDQNRPSAVDTNLFLVKYYYYYIYFDILR